MAILTSLFSGISGLNANGTALSVVGDNIANVNTVGFKGSRVNFADILSQNLGGGAGTSQIGRGVTVSTIQPQFTQGSFQTTGNVLDLAIDGDGLFIVKNASGTFYTRAGAFHINKDGYVVNPEGAKLQGYGVTSSGSISGSLGDINLSSTTVAPTATTSATITVNLDARKSGIAGAIDMTDPNTYHFSTAITIYDSLGNPHLMTIYFQKDDTTPLQWNWVAGIDGGEIQGGTAGTPYQVGSGTITFTSSGAYSSATGTSLTIDWLDTTGAADSSVTLDFSKSTQYGSASAAIFQSQNGSSSGALSSISVDQDGIITGLFTNGQTKKLAQVALADFENPSGLLKVGKNLFAESSQSGQPLIGKPRTSGKGSIASNSLELSNVDLAEEFVKLITYQRGFQANSRIISVTDDLLNELVNLKR